MATSRLFINLIMATGNNQVKSRGEFDERYSFVNVDFDRAWVISAFVHFALLYSRSNFTYL